MSGNVNEVNKAILDFFIQTFYKYKEARNAYSEQK